MVQLSHALNPEAGQGHYKLSAHTHTHQRSHLFQVQKYGMFHLTFFNDRKLTFLGVHTVAGDSTQQVIGYTV